MKYSIVLPCYNESGNIQELVDKYQSFSEDWDIELILVNNGSTDNTAELLRDIEAVYSFVRVVTIEKNIGYGHGIHTGLKSASGQIVAYSHADSQTPPADLFRAFSILVGGQIDTSKHLVKGHRPGRDKENLCTAGLIVVTSIMTGYKFEDINGQPKVFHRSLLDKMSAPPMDFSYDAYVLYMAARSDYSISSIDVEFGQRGYGVSKSAATAIKRYKTILSFLGSLFKIVWANRRDPANPLGQIMRFVLVGLGASGISYLMFLLTYTCLNFHYTVASVIGFGSGFVVGFISHRSWTFGISRTKASPELFRFLVVNLFSLLANVCIIWAAVDILGFIPEIGQILALIGSAMTNFIGMKLWVFKQI